MKRYEGLFILNTAGKEEGVKEAIDKISCRHQRAWRQSRNGEKMDRKTFARVADNKHTGGFSNVNIIFSAAPSAVAQIRSRFAMSEEVFRLVFTQSPEPKPAT